MMMMMMEATANLLHLVSVNSTETTAALNILPSLQDVPSRGSSPASVWIMSLACAALVGFTGIIPMIVLPKDVDSSSSRLRLLLAFSVGGLLGDVFLHLLPEAWARSYLSHDANLALGLWVVIGLFTFTSLEVFFSTKVIGHEKNDSSVTGYLNVLANGIDNFSHGLAVAASFCVGTKIGILTTFAIVLHEIPHEFGDFVILLKSGFSKWEAAKAQLSTASIGLLGAAVALTAESIEVIDSRTGWIIPFTAGGFLHIAMVSILPDLVREENPTESLKQVFAVASGVAVMGFVNFFCH